MSKTYTHAGVSKLDGKIKLRVANGISRIDVLVRNNHTDIDIIELKYAMTKEDAAQFLFDIRFYEQHGVVNQEVKAALEAELTKLQPKQPKEKRVSKLEMLKRSVAEPADGVSISAIKIHVPQFTQNEVADQLADLEDLPF